MKKARNSIEIKVWMVRNRVKLIDICEDLGFHNKTVWATIQGQESNVKVLAWLLNRGCPQRHLALPAGMRGQV